jgi:hypothetical protein
MIVDPSSAIMRQLRGSLDGVQLHAAFDLPEAL